MKLIRLLPLLILTVLFKSCIKDDFVKDFTGSVLRITNPIDTLKTSTDYQLKAMYLNNIGKEEEVNQIWTSSAPNIITVDQTGLLTAVSTTGESIIKVQYQQDDIDTSDQITISVGNTTTESSTLINSNISTISSYKLKGSFKLEKTDDGSYLSFEDDYEASTALPGLYVYLSNNRNSIANAFEIGKVTVFNGEHEYNLPNIGLNDYSYIIYFCKPFNVKVGEGKLQD